jgi:hypothetical protein
MKPCPVPYIVEDDGPNLCEEGKCLPHRPVRDAARDRRGTGLYRTAEAANWACSAAPGKTLSACRNHRRSHRFHLRRDGTGPYLCINYCIRNPPAPAHTTPVRSEAEAIWISMASMACSSPSRSSLRNFAVGPDIPQRLTPRPPTLISSGKTRRLILTKRPK